MGFDYGSSDHTYATIFTVNRFSKDFSLERMWWSRKGPRFLLGVASILLKSFPHRCCCRRLSGCQSWTLSLYPRLT